MPSFILAQLEWKEIFVGEEEWAFLWEVVLRTGLMFLIIILALRILGKRSVKQLSIFELVVIIGLGSAAGDPMFYKEVGILTATIVFTVVILLYSIITFIIGKVERFERIMEGSATYIIRNGKFDLENFNKEKLGSQEIMSEIRLKGISQLGQVEIAIEEMSGDLSVFFYEDEEVKYGLPTMPELLKRKLKFIEKEAHYSCLHCGFTEIKTIGEGGKCQICNNEEWVLSSNKRRVT
ncbi:MAG: YetF domain-containing protein [Moheibacter sp.]